jgi:hypothetical protein
MQLLEFSVYWIVFSLTHRCSDSTVLNPLCETLRTLHVWPQSEVQTIINPVKTLWCSINICAFYTNCVKILHMRNPENLQSSCRDMSCSVLIWWRLQPSLNPLKLWYFTLPTTITWSLKSEWVHIYQVVYGGDPTVPTSFLVYWITIPFENMSWTPCYLLRLQTHVVNLNVSLHIKSWLHYLLWVESAL